MGLTGARPFARPPHVAVGSGRTTGKSPPPPTQPPPPALQPSRRGPGRGAASDSHPTGRGWGGGGLRSRSRETSQCLLKLLPGHITPGKRAPVLQPQTEEKPEAPLASPQLARGNYPGMGTKAPLPRRSAPTPCSQPSRPSSPPLPFAGRTPVFPAFPAHEVPRRERRGQESRERKGEW